MKKLDIVPKIWLYGVLAFVGIIIALFASYVSPRPSSVRNERQLIRLLTSAHFDREGPTNMSKTVVLSDGSRLDSDIERSIVGYRVIAHCHATTFSIEARPVVAGTTGVFSFFLDEAGKLHFQPVLGKAAGPDDRLWRRD